MAKTASDFANCSELHLRPTRAAPSWQRLPDVKDPDPVSHGFAPFRILNIGGNPVL
jgi:hypothetical protein